MAQAASPAAMDGLVPAVFANRGHRVRRMAITEGDNLPGRYTSQATLPADYPVLRARCCGDEGGR
jgi:hypothetical protein